jgi:proteasome lid subunit RPN8/RPN11
VLVLPRPLWERVVAHCLDQLPLEACGLLAGAEMAPAGACAPAGGAGNSSSHRAAVHEVYPAANAARSARLYTVEPKDLLAADRAAEKAGRALIGVWHSHTHTPAYPSPTDIAQVPDPAWHYVVVSLSDTEPVLRSYRIRDSEVQEEPVVVPF